MSKNKKSDKEEKKSKKPKDKKISKKKSEKKEAKKAAKKEAKKEKKVKKENSKVKPVSIIKETPVIKKEVAKAVFHSKTNLSTNFNAKTAISMLRKMLDTNTIANFVKGDERATVKAAASSKVALLGKK